MNRIVLLAFLPVLFLIDVLCFFGTNHSWLALRAESMDLWRNLWRTGSVGR